MHLVKNARAENKVIFFSCCAWLDFLSIEAEIDILWASFVCRNYICDSCDCYLTKQLMQKELWSVPTAGCMMYLTHGISSLKKNYYSKRTCQLPIPSPAVVFSTCNSNKCKCPGTEMCWKCIFHVCSSLIRIYLLTWIIISPKLSYSLTCFWIKCLLLPYIHWIECLLELQMVCLCFSQIQCGMALFGFWIWVIWYSTE